jgi:hypothetical protein
MIPADMCTMGFLDVMDDLGFNIHADNSKSDEYIISIKENRLSRIEAMGFVSYQVEKPKVFRAEEVYDKNIYQTVQ